MALARYDCLALVVVICLLPWEQRLTRLNRLIVEYLPVPFLETLVKVLLVVNNVFVSADNLLMMW